MFSGNVLGSRAGRLASFGILYVAEGIPLGFAAVAMAAYMRRQGLAVEQIGAFVGAFYLPWAFKWAWAPLVDLVRLDRLGGRKAWIVLCQALMILTLFAVVRLDYGGHFQLLIALVFVKDPTRAWRAAEKAASVWSALVASVRSFACELFAGFFLSGMGPLSGVAFALLPMGAMALSASISSTLQVDSG